MSPSPADDSPIGAWFQEHRGIFERVARSFARGEAEVADLRQEMLFQLWRTLPGFSGQAKRSTWVYRVCLNTALTWRRGVQRRERNLDREARLEGLAGDGRSPAESADRRDLLAQIYAALRVMPEFDRALVLLSLDGLAYRDMAEVTGLTENHVGVALTRARKRLAELLKGVINELE